MILTTKHQTKKKKKISISRWLLIPIFETYFLQAQFNQARLPCGLNSCIILYFKHGPNPYDLWGKLKKCGLEGMSWFFSNLLQEPRPSMLPSGQGTLVAPQAHGRSFVPEIFTLKEFLYSG